MPVGREWTLRYLGVCGVDSGQRGASCFDVRASSVPLWGYVASQETADPSYYPPRIRTLFD